LDFIGDCYAFQSFVCDSGPVGIAWAANWADVRRKHDFPSSMTFPRRLIWREGRLHMPPVDALATLRTRRLAMGAAALACPLATPDGLSEIDLSGARRGAPFRVLFSHPQCEMALVYDGVNLEFVGASAAGTPRASIDNLAPRDVRIFVDVGIIEVFVDDGLWCGTKRIDADEPVDTILIDAAPDAFSHVAVWGLRPQAGA
jgi:beta-fructofuranosidase